MLHKGKKKMKPKFDWENYSGAKKQKLDDQFRREMCNEMEQSEVTSKIFDGVSIFVNGYTVPSPDELKRLMMLNGGKYHHYKRRSTTHIIASNLALSKIKNLRKEKVVKPDWIIDSIKAARILPHQPYLLYPISKLQPKLNLVPIPKPSTFNDYSLDKCSRINKSACLSFNDKSIEKELRQFHISETALRKECQIDRLGGNYEHCSSINSKINYADGTFKHRKYSLSQHEIVEENPQSPSMSSESSNSSYSKSRQYEDKIDLCEKITPPINENEEFAVDQIISKPNPQICCSAADNPRFLDEFYSHSRLHYISTWLTEFRNFVQNLQTIKDPTFPQRNKLKDFVAKKIFHSETNEIFENSVNFNQRIIMHIDMDSFFVSVGILSRPDLVGKPVAVTHSRGQQNMVKESIDNKDYSYKDPIHQDLEHVDQSHPMKSTKFNSMAGISCCNYEARAFGVNNRMYLGDAKKLCPELQTISYDFEKYKEIAQILYETIACYTYTIEAVSCDELFVDCTEIIEETGITPLDLATFLRQEIKKKTKCNASAGLASNVLLARLATRVAKPNGQYYVTDDAIDEFMKNIAIENLPGVGMSIKSTLSDLNIKSCCDLQQLSLGFLQRKFGSNIGHKLYNYCRGIDNRPIRTERERKSVSAEVNYGIRFTQNVEAIKFISELAENVSHKLISCGMKGKLITLKLKVRSSDAPVKTSKFMGHGICDNITKSYMLTTATDDADILAKECISLLRQLHVNPSDLRGLGIQLSRLEISTKTRTLNHTMLNYLKQNKKPPESSYCKRKVETDANHSHLGRLKNKLPIRLGELEDYRKDNSQMLNLQDSNLPSYKSGSGHNFSDNSQEDFKIFTRIQKDCIDQIDNKKSSVKNNTDDQQPSTSYWEPQGSSSNYCKPQIQNTKIEVLPSLSQLDPMCLKALPPELLEEIKEAYGYPEGFPDHLHSKLCSSNPTTTAHSPKVPNISESVQISKVEEGGKPQNCKLIFQKHLDPRFPEKIISQNKNIDQSKIMHKEKKEDKLKEMKKPNLCGAIELNDVKAMILEWLVTYPVPEEKDLEMFVSYLSDLVADLNIEKLDLVLKYLYRLLHRYQYKEWREAYQYIIKSVQIIMKAIYGSQLKVIDNF